MMQKKVLVLIVCLQSTQSLSQAEIMNTNDATEVLEDVIVDDEPTSTSVNEPQTTTARLINQAACKNRTGKILHATLAPVYAAVGGFATLLLFDRLGIHDLNGPYADVIVTGGFTDEMQNEVNQHNTKSLIIALIPFIGLHSIPAFTHLKKSSTRWKYAGFTTAGYLIPGVLTSVDAPAGVRNVSALLPLAGSGFGMHQGLNDECGLE